MKSLRRLFVVAAFTVPYLYALQVDAQCFRKHGHGSPVCVNIQHVHCKKCSAQGRDEGSTRDEGATRVVGGGRTRVIPYRYTATTAVMPMQMMAMAPYMPAGYGVPRPQVARDEGAIRSSSRNDRLDKIQDQIDKMSEQLTQLTNEVDDHTKLMARIVLDVDDLRKREWAFENGNVVEEKGARED